MIKSRKEYYYYRECDKLALGIRDRRHPKLLGDDIWKFEILLRKAEYYKNCKKNIINKMIYYIIYYKFKKKSIKLGFTIPLNVFEQGLSIAHYGTIVVNENAKVGKNCRIHTCTTIGATNGQKKAPKIGDNVYIGSGAKIIGDITIGDDIAIGANAVVNKNFERGNCTIGGVPAKIISDNNSHNHLCKLLKENKML